MILHRSIYIYIYNNNHYYYIYIYMCVCVWKINENQPCLDDFLTGKPYIFQPGWVVDMAWEHPCPRRVLQGPHAVP